MLFDYSNEWQNPSNILAVLTIIGADIIRGAIAQLVSYHPRPFTPVAFSFGWVAYSFSAILAAIGSRRLTPDPDCDCILIDAESGYARDVKSWVLARLVRDYQFPRETPLGLTIAFYRTLSDKPTGVPDRDWVYYSGVIVIFLQLSIAAIPVALKGNWPILILTAAGILLVQLQAALPQWQRELWAARPITEGRREVVCLTRGNGSPYVVVVISEGCGLKLSDLASGRGVQVSSTVPATFLLAVLWLVHILGTQGVQDGTWFLLAIGGIGMVQNALAYGTRRKPGALGFHLKEVSSVQEDKVFNALVEAEKFERGVGIALTPVFFPGGLRPNEEEWKQKMISQYAEEKKKEKEEKEKYTEAQTSSSTNSSNNQTAQV